MNGVGQAQNLRNNMTNAERALWRELKERQIEGCKFRRQCPVGPYIVDFVCLERMLVVEVDGGQHSVRQEEDEQRTAWLKRNGYAVLRFWNNEVLQQRDAVLEVIHKTLIDLTLRPEPNLDTFAKEAKSADSTKTSAITSLPPRGRTGGGESNKVAAAYSDRPHPSLPPWGEGAGKLQPPRVNEKAVASAITSPLPTGGGQGEGELNKVAAVHANRPHPDVHAGQSLSGTLRAASPCTNSPGANLNAIAARRANPRDGVSSTAVLPFCLPWGEGAEKPAFRSTIAGDWQNDWNPLPKGDH